MPHGKGWSIVWGGIGVNEEAQRTFYLYLCEVWRSSAEECHIVIKTFIGAIILIALVLAPYPSTRADVPPDKEILIDRCDDISRWSVDAGWEFPGAEG